MLVDVWLGVEDEGGKFRPYIKALIADHTGKKEISFMSDSVVPSLERGKQLMELIIDAIKKPDYREEVETFPTKIDNEIN